MNQRLIDVYDGFTLKHHEKFLTNDIEFDAMWGKPIKGVTLQIDLSEDVRDALYNLQDELSKLEPEALLLTPRPFQHISFNQVVYWSGNYKLGHDQTWAAMKKDFLAKFQNLDNRFPSFPISFIKLIPMTSAIIWAALDEHDKIQTLREAFKAKLPFPTETTKGNTFIHTTVARYKTKLRNPLRVLQFLEAYKASTSMMVNEIILRKESQYPTMQSTELARIQLQ
ncbi:MAG: hypothetical protein HZA34_04830 [Candidatus Pacebacteria bacterium]|nr:hypothetical protein [Candidatus Paceibacterota bacterium]